MMKVVGYLNWLNFAKTNILTRCWKTCYNILFNKGNLAHLIQASAIYGNPLKIALIEDLI